MQSAYWIALSEALDHIQNCEQIEFHSAWSDLTRALAYGNIEGRMRLRNKNGYFTLAHDVPAPRDILLWGAAVVIQEDPLVVMFEENFWSDKYRGDEKWDLIIRKDTLLATWPLKHREDERSFSIKKPTADEVREIARKVYRCNRDNPPNMDDAEREIRKELGPGARLLIRTVLREPEFARLRRPAGNQRKD